MSLQCYSTHPCLAAVSIMSMQLERKLMETVGIGLYVYVVFVYFVDVSLVALSRVRIAGVYSILT